MNKQPRDFGYFGEDSLPEWVKDDHLDDSGAVWYGSSPNPRRPSSKEPPDPVLAKLVEELFDPHPLRSHVITLHLYVEYWMDKILKGLGKISISRLTFHQKAEQLDELEVLDGDLLHNVRLINQLRNIFAHELDLESADVKVTRMLGEFRSDPYFSSSDRDPFRSVCIQTIFAMEATFKNGCRPLTNTRFPTEKVRAKLLKEGKLFWQECELLSKEVRGTEHIYQIKCPLCSDGIIEREKETLVGHKESNIFPCRKCGLRGDGSFLTLDTAKPEFLRMAKGGGDQ